MITLRSILVRSLFVLALVCVGSPPAPSSARVALENQASEEVDDLAVRLTAGLEKRGFEVGQGYFHIWGIEQCPESFTQMGTCYFNNPAAPYVFPTVPYWPDEFVDPATSVAFGETEPGYGTTFRFDPNEAIVIFGYLPPEAAYLGLQSYLFTRKGTYQTDSDTYRFLNSIGAKDIFFHTLPQNPGRIGSFDSLSNSNNNVVIQRQSGGSWGQLRYFIITPDRFMEKQVRQVLKKLAVAEKDIFSEAIPSNVTIGLDEEADEFLAGIRYSRPSDGGGPGSPSDQWRNNPSMRILRIRDTREDRPAQRYPAWEDTSPEQRTALPEAYLKSDLTSLVYQVSQAWGQTCVDPNCSTQAVRFIDTQSYPFNLVGPKCDDIGMDCLGDTQDASYQFRPGFGFDNNEVYAVIGTLGTATGNATYVSLGLNNTRLRLGAKNIDGTELAGSALWYPGANNLDKLYVYYFTRDCLGLQDLTHGFCVSVEDTQFVIPPGAKASFVERDYIRVGTQRGPDSTLTLPSMVLKLQRPAVP